MSIPSAAYCDHKDAVFDQLEATLWPQPSAYVKRSGSTVLSNHVNTDKLSTPVPFVKVDMLLGKNSIEDEAKQSNNLSECLVEESFINYSREESIVSDIYSDTVGNFFFLIKRFNNNTCSYCFEKQSHCYIAGLDSRHSIHIKQEIDNQARTSIYRSPDTV